MDIQFLPDDSENWLPGYSSDYMPEFFLTPDRKILKKVYLGRVTYHLPETHQVVAFSDLGAAFRAAYGRALPQGANGLTSRPPRPNLGRDGP